MLSEQLRWHDEAGSQNYEAAKDEVTEHLYGEIDAFVSDSFRADSASADKVKAGLDSLLGRKKGDAIHNLAFLADLPAGRFLIAGIELWRGGPAINADAFSFRAYAASGNKFKLVAAISDMTNSAGVGLHAQALQIQPVNGEFWFLALAESPPHAPPPIALRLYAFNGQAFRTVWAPGNFLAEGVDSAVTFNSDGTFVVNELFDPTGQSAGSPTEVRHRQYTVTPDGPRKIAEWNAQRQ